MDEKVELQTEDATISLEYYIKTLLTLLGYLKIWKIETFPTWKNCIVMGVTSVLLIANFTLILSEVAAAAWSLDVQLIANIIGTLGLHTTGFIKWVYCLKKNREIAMLLTELKKCNLLCLRLNTNDPNYVQYKVEMNKAGRSSCIFIYMWLYCCIYGVVHWCMNPFLVKLSVATDMYTLNDTTENSNILPYIAWYPWDTHTVYGYLFTYFIQSSGAVGSALGVVAYDTFYVSVLMIACAQFQYLNFSLNEENSGERFSGMEYNLQVKLRNCVKHHSTITKVLDTLEVLASPTMFVQCIETLFVICLLSFEASAITITNDVQCMMKLWSMLEYFSACAIQLYMFCVYSTMIKFLSLQVADSVYFCGWEHTARTKNSETGNVKYLVAMMLMRAQKPIVLTGGPFYALSLETFKAIMGMALSNAVILRQVSEANNERIN